MNPHPVNGVSKPTLHLIRATYVIGDFHSASMPPSGTLSMPVNMILKVLLVHSSPLPSARHLYTAFSSGGCRNAPNNPSIHANRPATSSNLPCKYLLSSRYSLRRLTNIVPRAAPNPRIAITILLRPLPNRYCSKGCSFLRRQLGRVHGRRAPSLLRSIVESIRINGDDHGSMTLRIPADAVSLKSSLS